MAFVLDNSPVRARPLMENRLSRTQLVNIRKHIGFQLEILAALAPFQDGDLPMDFSIFETGNEGGHDEEQRTRVVVRLLERHFELAFRVMTDFQLQPAVTYARSAATMARMGRSSQFMQLLKNVGNSIRDVERDQVVFAAVNVYAKTLKDVKTASALVPQLVGRRTRVLAYVACGKLKKALKVATEGGTAFEDVEVISQEAQRLNDSKIKTQCEKILREGGV